jgi:hypothetical protein
MSLPFSPNPKLEAILKYISLGWEDLTRSTSTCAAVADPKLLEATVLYLPANFAIPATLQTALQECNVKV